MSHSFRLYLSGKSLFGKTLGGEIFIRTLPKTPLPFPYYIILYYQVIVKSIIGSDNAFR